MAGVKGETTVQEPTRAEATLARRSAEARATIPDFELTAEVDFSKARALPFGATAILLRACALALRAVPRANGAYRDGRFELYSRINVGVVIAGAQGLAAPTVFDADQKALSELELELSRLHERARARELTSPELAGATFTLLDMGGLGVDAATPLLAPPQAAAIAAGEVRELPRIKDGAIVPAATMTLTLAVDSRILYGALAAEFLTQVATYLEEASL
jgi:pyruvate dehydrogenase E2 component (dihydrolipoamide acetyltransferase)